MRLTRLIILLALVPVLIESLIWSTGWQEYHRADEFHFRHTRFYVALANGAFAFTEVDDSVTADEWHWATMRLDTNPDIFRIGMAAACDWHRLGFGFNREEVGALNPEYETAVRTCVVPGWICCVAIALFEVVLIRRFFTADCFSNLCGKCGYDLRASPDRCPECGTVASASRRR